jgi:o-succinylbenzoate synthase
MRSAVVHVRVPFRRPIETAAGLWTHRDSWISIEQVADEMPLLGEGPTPGEAIGLQWQDVSRSVAVNALLGGGPLDEVVAAARAARADGFGTIKMKVGAEGSIDELRERVGAVREAIGPGAKLRLDANEAWSIADAPERMRSVWDLDIEYVEQPIPASAGAAAMAELRTKCPVPVAADEAVVSVEAARELVEAGAADVLVVKPSRVGGWRAASAISLLASDVGIPVVLSTLFETGVGISVALMLAAGEPEGLAHGLATAHLLESDLLKRPLEIRAGRMIVPEAVELDEEALDRYAVGWIGA